MIFTLTYIPYSTQNTFLYTNALTLFFTILFCFWCGVILSFTAAATAANSDSSKNNENDNDKMGSIGGSIADDGGAHEFFLREAEYMISEIEEALEPLLEVNPGYKINRIASDNLEVDCDGFGTYTFRTDHTLGVIGVMSPVSGINKSQ